MKIHIVNPLEHFFHISSIEPADLLGLPEIIPQAAKFLWQLYDDPYHTEFVTRHVDKTVIKIGRIRHLLLNNFFKYCKQNMKFFFLTVKIWSFGNFWVENVFFLGGGWVPL